jgi:hypothetical protein
LLKNEQAPLQKQTTLFVAARLGSPMSNPVQRHMGNFFLFKAASSSTSTSRTSTSTQQPYLPSPISSSTKSADVGTHQIQEFLRYLVLCNHMPQISKKGIPLGRTQLRREQS